MGREKIVQDLSSKDRQVIIGAVNALSGMAGDQMVQRDLIELVISGLSAKADPTDYAPFWAMIVLGKFGSCEAVPVLLSMLDTDWDVWMEAAAEALESIARMHSDIIFPELEEHVLSRMDNDPSHGRLFVYSAFAAMAESEQAKRFLIQQYEEDEMWSEAIAGDLIQFNDPTILPILRRGIELARAFDGEHAEVESLEAYCRIDGMPDPLASFPRIRIEDRDWQERWKYMLDELSVPTTEDSAQDSLEEAATDDDDSLSLAKPPRSLLESDDPFIKQMKEHTKRRDAWPLKDFCLKDYLGIRPRSVLEQQMQDALVFVGLSKLWTVEKLQALINASKKPSDALDILLDSFEFPSKEALESFGGLCMALWNATPREEFQGLTPSEKCEAIDYADAEPYASQKISRNAPCPCGSGKKYKKCHGQ